MCWNQTIEWERDGHEYQVGRFLELLCAFCIAYPDDNTTTFPERVALSHLDHPDQISNEDVEATRRLGVRGNLADEVVEQLRHVVRETGCLSADNLPLEWCLFQIEDHDWDDRRERIRRLLEPVMNIQYVKQAVATKLLWIKRPQLIPICDSVVMKVLVGNAPNTVEGVMRCMDDIRSIGRANIEVLETARDHLAHRLPEGNAYRNLPLVRILDVVLWYYHTKPQRVDHAALLDHGDG